MAEIEKKKCFKCLKDLPKTTEFFSKNKATLDGFEGQCKNCRKKYFEDYRKKHGAAPKKTGGNGRRQKVHHRNQNINPPPIPTTKATPAEILIALRRGMAQEIVDIIKEKYDL